MLFKACRKKKHETKPGEILDQVISQSSSSANKCLLYKLANYKRGALILRFRVEHIMTSLIFPILFRWRFNWCLSKGWPTISGGFGARTIRHLHVQQWQRADYKSCWVLAVEIHGQQRSGYPNRSFALAARSAGQVAGSQSVLANAVSWLIGREFAARADYMRHKDPHEIGPNSATCFSNAGCWRDGGRRVFGSKCIAFGHRVQQQRIGARSHRRRGRCKSASDRQFLLAPWSTRSSSGEEHRLRGIGLFGRVSPGLERLLCKWERLQFTIGQQCRSRCTRLIRQYDIAYGCCVR